ncbi:hypothetical protein CYMTET_16742 [Cymbomonas tetramitiformis]|uniref:Uncharacterized protein n=1 Tax=Cymbomonas tetramitiformis TaxID=36881 RepID=A0AAE0GBD0_9CHLO|nr:hypothetical protein CYMTET_16742 [Cymbomonas tetramitiformis]
MPKRDMREIILLSVDCFKHFCMEAKIARGRLVRDYYIEPEERLLNGDLTLASEVVQNYDEVHGTRSQVTVATVDRQLTEHGIQEFNDIAQVKDWLASVKNSREISVHVTNVASNTVSPSVTFLTNIQTIINGAIFGFFEKGFDNTHDFLTAYGMDAKLGAAACMTENQLHYRKMLAQLVWTFINTTPGATREDVIQYAESQAIKIYDECIRWELNKLFKPADENCKQLLTYAEQRISCADHRCKTGGDVVGDTRVHNALALF